VEWDRVLVGFLAAFGIATVTAPVGVSGAVFLLPVQLSVLHVPNPAVTPTNLLYNVVAGPGALLRYARRGSLASPLARRLVVATVPGVVVGAALRVHVVSGPGAFRLIAAVVLLAIGVWLIRRTLAPAAYRPMGDRTVSVLALGVGVIGGIYGIGGGSILGPILVGSGMTMAVVAPAALLSTFAASLVGAVAFSLLALTSSEPVAPEWSIGIACGLGGVLGGYLGARLQPRLPERALRLLLGSLAVLVGLLYAIQSLP
jgi:uncharacterized protein